MTQYLLFLISSPLTIRFYHHPRQSGREDVIGFLVSNKVKVKSHSVPIYFSFEAIWIEISDCSFAGYCLCLYHHRGITSSFFVDFHDLVTSDPECVMLGDLNLHLVTQSTATSTFNDNLPFCC